MGIQVNPQKLAQTRASAAGRDLAASLDGLFMGLPDTVRARFYPLKAAIKLALEQADYPAARLILDQANIQAAEGLEPDLEALRAQMLACFGGLFEGGPGGMA